MTSLHHLTAGSWRGPTQWWKNYVQYFVSVHDEKMVSIIKNHMKKDLHDNWSGTLKESDNHPWVIVEFSDEQSMTAFLLRFG